jgi:hypothetical protein
MTRVPTARRRSREQGELYGEYVLATTVLYIELKITASWLL